MSENSLLVTGSLPDFSKFAPDQVGPALDVLIPQVEQAIDAAIAETEPTWTNCIQPLSAATDRLRRAWGVVNHLMAVVDTPELRQAYQDNLDRVTALWTRIGQDDRLYRQYKAIQSASNFAELSAEQQRAVELAVRDFRLGGAELPEAAKPRFAEIQQELAQLSQKFSDNVLDATQRYACWVRDPARLAGLPASSVAMALAEAKSRASADAEAEAQPDAAAGAEAWCFTLQFPSYFPVMQYADDRALREELYRAYCTRASEFGPGELNNNDIMQRILALRTEEAKMLGFEHYAQASLATKMAQSSDEVFAFLRDLATKARPYAEHDMASLRDFAASELGMSELAAWDVTYVSEKLRQHRYAYSDEEVRQYFPLPQVLNGLFGLIHRLFDVRVVPDEAVTWHPDVQFFKILDASDRLIGQFYLDLYARAHKRGGAWMDDQRGRQRLSDGQVVTPVAYLVCNFTPPLGDQPSLLTHDEVTTLFHEMGHGLHHLLTRVDELAVSGINGVEWDAVELPSQFLENFCWEWEILHAMTAHASSGEPLPKALFHKMMAAKNYQSGLQMMRQLEFSLFDMSLHAGTVADVHATLIDVRRETSVFPPPEFNRFENSFSHIFAGGYAAGYYSYKWAEVLSADVYTAFEENPSDVVGVGQRYLNEILSVGGSRPAYASFMAFRGRAPSIDPLLRHSGLSEAFAAETA